MHFFQPETSRWKTYSFYEILIPVIKTVTTPQIKKNRIWVAPPFDMYLAIFTQFFCDFDPLFCASHKSKKTSCILNFSRTNSYFQGWFYKIPGQFQEKRPFFLIQGVLQDQGQITSVFLVCANPEIRRNHQETI